MPYIIQWTSEDKSTHEVYYIYEDGREQKVNNDKPGFLTWLEEGNIPEERDYIAPPVIDPYEGMSLDQKIARRVAEKLMEYGYSQELMAAILWNKIAGRNIEEFDQMESTRLAIIMEVYQEEGVEPPIPADPPV